MPLTLSVMYDEEAIAEPHPKVLNLTSVMMPCESEIELRLCGWIRKMRNNDLVANLDLELHDIAASWGADESLSKCQ